MKRLLFCLGMFFASYSNTSAIQLHIDSMKVVPASDTTYYLAIYGLITPAGPCHIVDSAKVINQHQVKVWLCYVSNSSATLGCVASDSIYLGALPNASYMVQLYLAVTDSPLNNTCQTTARKDTFEINHSFTAIEETGENQLELWPNPAADILEISLPSNSSPISLTLMDLDGQIRREIITTNRFERIVLDGLPAGMYIVLIRDQQHQWLRRFVKGQ